MSTANKFTWGDFVRVKDTAPSEYHPGDFADVCGIDRLMTSDRASAFGRDIGTYVYIIEFGDGSSLEAPEDCLELFNGEYLAQKIGEQIAESKRSRPEESMQ